MGIGDNKILGVAIGPSGLLLAEVLWHNHAPKILRSAELPYPQGLSLDTPAELGKALATLLRQQGISTRRAIIGLPAKWLITRRRDIPPAASDTAAKTLRLYAEGEFSSDLKDLCVDFAGQTSTSSSQSVLVVGTSRGHIDNCRIMAKSAGLRLRSVTVTGAALGTMVDPSAAGALLILCVGNGNAEIVLHQSGVPVQLRHISLANAPDDELIAELRRAMAGAPKVAGPLSIVLAGPSSALVSLQKAATDRLGIEARIIDTTSITLANSADAALFSPAIAVALAGLRSDPGTVDFLHSRLAPPKVHDRRKQLLWGGAVAAAVALFVASSIYDLYHQQQQILDLKAHLAELGPDIKKAQTGVDRLATARSWTAGQPRFLACLGELTTLFPDEGSIWATNLSIHQDLTGQLSGKAASEQQVLALYDKIKDSKRFSDPKLLEMRDSSKTSHEIAFSISFAFRAPE